MSHVGIGTESALRAVILMVLLVGGCGNRASDRPPTLESATTTPSSVGAAASTSSSTTNRPMTADELVWLETITRIPKNIAKVLADSTELTSPVMRSLANELRRCTRELVQPGSPSARLQPVYDLAQQGCAQYDKAAACFDTAAKIGIPVGGSAEDRKQTEAIHCGFDASMDASKALANAANMAYKIRDAARQ